MQERDLVRVLVLYHLGTELPGFQPNLQAVLDVHDSVPDFLTICDNLCHVGGDVAKGRVELRDAEEVDFDSDGVDQYEMREWTDVEHELAVLEHVMAIAHSASPQAVSTSAIERRFIKSFEPVLGAPCIPQGVLTRKRDVKL